MTARLIYDVELSNDQNRRHQINNCRLFKKMSALFSVPNPWDSDHFSLLATRNIGFPRHSFPKELDMEFQMNSVNRKGLVLFNNFPLNQQTMALLLEDKLGRKQPRAPFMIRFISTLNG